MVGAVALLVMAGTTLDCRANQVTRSFVVNKDHFVGDNVKVKLMYTCQPWPHGGAIKVYTHQEGYRGTGIGFTHHKWGVGYNVLRNEGIIVVLNRDWGEDLGAGIRFTFMGESQGQIDILGYAVVR